MKRINRKSLPVVLAKKLMLRLLVLVVLLSGTAVVYAEIYPMGGSGGYTYWLSCGSSAGNYYYRCYAGSCEACDTGPCQESADQQCAMRGHAPIAPVDGPVQ